MERTATFFESPPEFRAWLEVNHASAPEIYVGFYKKSAGRATVTWAEMVDEALCFGWIDGIRQTIDDTSYRNRFTPRRPGSTWSLVNVANVAKLRELGLMRPAGEAAFALRKEERTGIYSAEQAQVALAPGDEALFRGNAPAWAYLEAQPTGYRRQATWWVISAKREETRQRRLATLIADSEAGRRLTLFDRRPG